MMELVLFANSKKVGDRCLAGLSGADWVRPVSRDNGAGIPTQFTLHDGRPLRPLDVIQFEVLRAAPLDYQNENLLIEPSSIRLIGTASSSEIQSQAAQAAAERPDFLNSPNDEVFVSDYPKIINDGRSLALINVEETKFVHHSNKWHVLAERDDQMWSLKVSDEYLLRDLTAENLKLGTPNRLTYGPSSICVSLIDPYSPYGNAPRHYKLAAGVAFMV